MTVTGNVQPIDPEMIKALIRGEIKSIRLEVDGQIVTSCRINEEGELVCDIDSEGAKKVFEMLEESL